MQHDETQDKKSTSLTRRQAFALPYIAATPSITEGAKAAKISRPTLYRWMNEPAFRDELERARAAAAELACAELQGLALKATGSLSELLEDPDPKVRNSAVRTALTHNSKIRNDQELRRQIDTVENALSLLKNAK